VRWKDEARLSYRNQILKIKFGSNFLIILGISIGVSVQIFIGSLIQGLQKGLVEKTIGASSQITITADTEDGTITDFDDLVEQVRNSDDRIEHISVASDYPAFMEIGEESQSLLVRGFALDKADAIYNIYDRIKEGTYPMNSDEIILGVDLKEEYDLALKDEINITTTGQKTVKAKIVGFFDLQVDLRK
jgi:lipoprotein-releasing system permease protein